MPTPELSPQTTTPLPAPLLDYLAHQSWRCGYLDRYGANRRTIIECQCGLDDLLRELGWEALLPVWAVVREDGRVATALLAREEDVWWRFRVFWLDVALIAERERIGLFVGGR